MMEEVLTALSSLLLAVNANFKLFSALEDDDFQVLYSVWRYREKIYFWICPIKPIVQSLLSKFTVEGICAQTVRVL